MLTVMQLTTTNYSSIGRILWDCITTARISLMGPPGIIMRSSTIRGERTRPAGHGSTVYLLV